MPNLAPRGVIAPMLTPFNDDMSIATDLYVDFAHKLLADGCAALAPFGTTGEALSVGIDERVAAIQTLLDSGIEPSQLIPGTGLSNVADSARLSRACLDLGCAAVLTLPPFYYKAVDEEGLYRYFVSLLDAIGSDARIFLYHIPPIAIVGIPPALVQRLHAEFPENFIGVKDSSGDWDNTRKLFDIDGLIVYPGSELPLIDALDLGGFGCITATANINAHKIAEVIRLYDNGKRDAAMDLHESIRQVRLIVQDYAPIPAQKRLLALTSGDARWANVRPPLTPLSEGRGKELSARLHSP